MVSTANDAYGHKAILARYAGVTGTPPILGYVQHGWRAGAAFTDGTYAPGLRKFVWTRENERETSRNGLRPVEAIGAPFLYLLRIRADVPDVVPGTVLSFPFHSSPESSTVRHDAAYAEYLAGLGADRVTVCLHPHDFADPECHGAFAGRGFDVVKNGDVYAHDFLDRQLDLTARHEWVTTNRACTALFYAAALGRRVTIGGPMYAIESERGEVFENEGAAFEELQRERYPQLLGEGVAGAEAKALGEVELGGDQLRSPGEVRQLFGWNQPQRMIGSAIAAATAARRAVKAR